MNEIPDWFKTGRAVLTMTNREKGNDATNFRPTTCLLLMWNIFTGIVSDKLYYNLESDRLMPEEQKRSQRKSRVVKGQLLIDNMILINSLCKPTINWNTTNQTS